MNLTKLKTILLTWLFCALAACYRIDTRRIERLEIFEGHVSIDGVVSDLSIQQAAEAPLASGKTSVIFIPREPLSPGRREEISHVLEDKLSSSTIGARQVMFCSEPTDATCRRPY